jgi:outer membrane protein OmpA-like peptidoglycan-associated protein
MKLFATVVTAVLLTAGCATKNWVRKNQEPVQAKVDEATTENTRQNESLGKLNSDLDETSRELGSTKERVGTAETEITKLGTRIDATNRDLSELRDRVANLDDYSVAGESVVYFGFNKDELTDEGKAELDKLVTESDTWKKYFISIEGYTDQIGPEEYNMQLSKRRAESVVRYLVLNHNIPAHRIYTIGLGKNRLVEEAKDRDARAKNRRVEVSVYRADGGSAAVAKSGSDSGSN